MTPSQATVGEGAAKQRGKAIPGWDGVAGRNRHDVGHGVFRSMWEEVRLLRSENKSLHGDFNALKGDFEALKEGFDRLLRSKGDVSAVRVGTDDAGQAKSQDESQDSKSQAKSQADGAAGGPSPKKKNNNNKKKKKKKKGGKVANIFGDAGGNLGKVAGGASAAKAVVGLVSVALLISIALGQGSLGKKSPSTWERKGGQPVTPNEARTVLMTGSDAEVVGEEIITPVKVLLPTKEDRRMLGVIEASHHQEGQKDGVPEKSQEADAVAVEFSTVKVSTVVDKVSSEGAVETNPPLVHEQERKFGKSSTLRKIKTKYVNVKMTKKMGLAAVNLNEVFGSTKIAGPSPKAEGTTKNSDRREAISLARSVKPMSSGVASLEKSMYDRKGEVPRAAQANTLPSPARKLFGRPTAPGVAPPPSPQEIHVGASLTTAAPALPAANDRPSVPIAKSMYEGGEQVRRAVQANNLFSRPEAPMSAFAGSPQENNDGTRLPPTAPILLPTTDHPTSSPEAATVFSPTYQCDADPERCGCPDLLQTDYRGPINNTKGGKPCAKWNDASVKEYPRAGLQGNFCRNPDNDVKGPWCYTTEENGDDDFGYCNVRKCQALTASPTASATPTLSAVPSGSPTSSSLPSSSSSPTRICPVANNEECGCDAVSQSDYRGMIATTNDGLECARWDDERFKPFTENDYSKDFPNSGLDENYCRNPGDDPSGAWCWSRFPNKEGDFFRFCNVPKCDPCKCMPRCDQTNDESCACPSVFQADECCNEDDASCKCHYLKDACSKSLENNGTDFCEDAERVCCNDNDNAYCKCEMYEQICSMSPGYSTCDFAAGSCCSDDFDFYWLGEQEQCFCDFYTYTSEADIFTDDRGYGSGNCSGAKSFQFGGPSKELRRLQSFYQKTGGDNWNEKTHWLNDTVPHCQWFGLKCDDEGRITDISLRNNSLTGKDVLSSINFHRLEKLDLAGNNLSGKARSSTLLFHRRLIHIDISDNQFSGHADMSFPPTTIHVNYSSNAFTSVGFKRFSPSYETLQVVDLRNNSFELDALNIFVNLPPRLEEFYLSNNAIRGALPNLIPLENVRIFNIANNAINGHLPDFSSPLLRKLDLSNQKQNENGGLIGKIPTAYSKLGYIVELNLAGNKLTGDIPSFAGALEVLDLSSNKLTNRIPLGLTNLKGAIIHLSGNSNISSPAPLDLCFFPNFDLRNDTSMCPPERNALKEFHDAAQGPDWDNATNWLDPYTSHCEWHGVTCSNETQNTINLTLKNNGLSGRLSKYISNLTSLEVLDLSENEMKGTIPLEIGLLSSLTKLYLRYNDFVGAISNESNFGHLQRLEVIHLHGNRLTGAIPELNLPFSGTSSYVSDCGNPSDFNESLVCEECTMCCNALGDCHHTEQTFIKKTGLNYRNLVGVFCACILVACFVLASALIAHDRWKYGNFPNSSIDRQPLVNRDKIHALESIGVDSVYRFFLGTSWSGWIIALSTVALQILMLFVFVLGAEVNWRTDKTDLVYTWRCPRDQDECRDTDDLNPEGWLAFVILMAAYLLVDIIKGIKMIVLSAKERHSQRTRMRYFIGGMLLMTVTCLTLYVSAIYNAAIATNDREIIANSVIILFITDIDEHFCAILMLVNKDWVKRISHDEDHQHEHAEEYQAISGRISNGEEDEEDSLRIYSPLATEPGLPTPEVYTRVQTLQDQVNTLDKLVQALQKTVAQQATELKKLQKEPRRL